MTPRTLATYVALWLLIATAVAAGVLVGSLLATAIAPDARAASRAALQAESPYLPGGMTTDAGTVPSPDFAGQRGQPERAKAVTPAPATAGQGSRPDHTPSPTIGTRAASTEAPETAASLSGLATWYDSPGGVSAAGPDLRAALGPGWRGTTVTVCAGDRCVVTVLGDWCGCSPRPGGPTVIDLHAPLFARLSPLGRGVLPIEVSW